MPSCFEKSFGKKLAVILDCFEIFERPSNLKARSNYKHYNIVKILLGITSQGVISFVSDSWGGRTSDKYLTEHMQWPFKEIIAGRCAIGFDVADSVAAMQATLHIPAFTKASGSWRNQNHIADIRIHVEHVIGSVRQRFSLLQSTLPVHFLTIRKGEDIIPLVDRIVLVCCALNNICDYVVPFD